MKLVLGGDRFVLSFVVVISGELSFVFEGFIIGQMGNGSIFVVLTVFVVLWLNDMVI